MDYAIRLAEEKDAAAFYPISLRSHTASYYDQLIPDECKEDFYAYYTRSSDAEHEFTAGIIRKIRHPDWRVAVAVRDDGSVVGYTIAHLRADNNLMLRGLFVDPDSHAKGAGTALFQLSLTWGVPGHPLMLSVIENNSVARGIYAKNGFVVTGVRAKSFFGAKMITMQHFAD
jgi:RimJ/RimL family protein N-acetyltransferase